MAPLIFQFTSVPLQPLQLKGADPIGWDSLKYLFARDVKRHGVLISVSVDLTFVKEAAAYLRLAYEGGTDATGAVVPAGGVEALVVLTVYEQDPNELRPVEIYRGRLDFTTYASAETGVTARFKETGFTTALLTRDDAAVDLFGRESLSGTATPRYEPATAQLHSQQTLQRFEMARTTPDDTPGEGLVTPDNESQLVFFGMEEPTRNEFDIAPFANGPVPGNVNSPANVPFYTAKARGPHTFTFRLDTYPRITQTSGAFFEEIDIKYEFETTRRGSFTNTRLLTFRRQSPNLNNGNLLPPKPAFPPSGDDYRYRLDTGPRVFVVDMEPGDQAYLYGEIFVHEFSGSQYVTTVSAAMGVGSYLRVSAPTTTDPTSCVGLLVHEAFERCAEAATDQSPAFYSEFYGRTDTRRPYARDGAGALRMVTSGFQLRGFPLPSAPAPPAGETDARKSLNVAFNDLYDGLDAIDCLGQGVEERDGRPVVRVEPRGYFYQEAEVLRLGAVSALTKRVYPELLHNAAEFGYSHWQSGAPNGLDEFNGRRTYSLPLTQVKRTYAAVSTLNAAGYRIEEARRDRFADGATKEGKADAEPFLICLRRAGTGFVSERLESFTSATAGILSPATAYNLRLSPGRMLRAHGPWLRAGLAAQPTGRLLPGRAEGNAHLVSQRLDEAAPLDEFAAVPVAELASPLVLAETYEFTVRLRRGQMATLQRNPYGRISFVDGLGQRKSGYLLRAERTPQGGLTTFTLLRAATP